MEIAADPRREAEPVSSESAPLPGRAVLRQEWNELAYFHWPYEPGDVQRLLPRGVRVDTFDGSAWVGLIPFEMRRVQIGATPPVPWLGNFIEVNVRTYVVDPLGRRAVWFFSLDVPRTAVVGVARTVFSLPYCWAAAEHTTDRGGEHHRYQLTRRWPRPPAGTDPARADIRFGVGESIPGHQVGELEHFLSARWALVTQRRGTLLYGRVDHPRWPLHRVHDVHIEQDLVEAAGLPSPVGEPLAMYSPGVAVRIAWFDRVDAEPGR